MKKSISVLILGILLFFVAAIFQSNIIGYSSFVVISLGFIFIAFSSWEMFLSMPVINLNSYNAINLSNLEIEIMANHIYLSRHPDTGVYYDPIYLYNKDICFSDFC
jgi:hypothetical protein